MKKGLLLIIPAILYAFGFVLGKISKQEELMFL